MIKRIIAELILFVLAMMIHDEYFGTLILVALMALLCWGVAERTIFSD